MLFRSLKELLARPLNDEEAKAMIVTLRSHSALQEARQQLHAMAREARALLAPLPDIAARRAFEALCDAVVERTA